MGEKRDESQDQPLSLADLDFEEAVDSILAVKPDRAAIRKPKKAEPKN